MANQITQWGATQWVGMLFGEVDVPDSYFVALCSRQPGTGIDGTQLALLEPPVTAASLTYARKELTIGNTDWALSDPGGGYVSNRVIVNFGLPDTNWGFTPYYALCDAATDGNIYAYGEFANAAALGTSYAVQIPIGALVFSAVSAQPSIVT